MIDRPPMAPGSLLGGSFRDLRGGFLPLCERLFRDHGDVVRMRIGPPRLGRELTLIFTPEGTHRVLAANQANYRKDSVNYGEVRYAVGDGLLTSQDETWQRQKRFLQPLFTPRRVAAYAATFGAETDRMAAEWRGAAGQIVDVHEAMTRLTLRIVCRVLFGNDVDTALPVIQRWFDPLNSAVRMRAFMPVRVPHSWPIPVNRLIHQGQAALFGVCDEIIAARRSAGRAASTGHASPTAHAHASPTEPTSPTGHGSGDMLGLLLDARDDGAALSDEEIRAQVLVFLLAGHETTATALTSAIYRLGAHPEVQERLRAEVAGLPGTPSAEQALGLSYTMKVLKETLRFYPSAPAIGRRAVADDEIGGFRITAGSDVVVSPWIVHRHPAHWPDPLRFDPERFTPDREKARDRYAWFPFGGGPRTCIGMHFSLLEGAVALAGLARRFAFESPAEQPRYESQVTLRPADGMPVRITHREVVAR